MKASATPTCDDCGAHAFRFHVPVMLVAPLRVRVCRWLCAPCYERAREQDALAEVAQDRAQAIVEAEQLRVEVAARGDA